MIRHLVGAPVGEVVGGFVLARFAGSGGVVSLSDERGIDGFLFRTKDRFVVVEDAAFVGGGKAVITDTESDLVVEFGLGGVEGRFCNAGGITKPASVRACMVTSCGEKMLKSPSRIRLRAQAWRSRVRLRRDWATWRILPHAVGHWRCFCRRGYAPWRG